MIINEFCSSCHNYIYPNKIIYISVTFSHQSDVIVVTFNYRLSWLGFLKGSTSELPGNQGMWDQLLALKWVRDNIRSFGGDPDDITIGGNSMGGESVSALSITPHAKGLFTKVCSIESDCFYVFMACRSIILLSCYQSVYDCT